MRKQITRKFMFVPAMKFVFSCTIISFKYNSVSTTTLYVYFIVKLYVATFDATENAITGTDFMSL